MATDELFPLVYDELHQLAERSLASERTARGLQPTALVHEAYIRLAGSSDVSWEGRAHFFGAAAHAIRRILVEHARSHGRLKRGGDRQRVPLEEAQLAVPIGPDVLALDDALRRLAQLDDRMTRIVELRFFAGLSVAQTGEVMSVSTATVARDWRLARVWLHAELGGGHGTEDAAAGPA